MADPRDPRPTHETRSAADIDVVRERPIIERTGFRLSWGAIMAGLIMALVTQIVLSVLGIAIGLTIWSPGAAVQDFGIGAGIWAAVAALISLFVGGVVVGRLAGVLTTGDGALHGGVMWGLWVIVTIWLTAAGLGAVVGGAFQLVGGVAGAATEMMGDDAAAVAMEAMGGDRDALAASIAERTGMSQAEARDVIRDAETRQRQMHIDTAQVRRTATDVADYAATGAWWTLLALGLSAGAAVGGASTTAKS
jgi:hypothetical protein